MDPSQPTSSNRASSHLPYTTPSSTSVLTSGGPSLQMDEGGKGGEDQSPLYVQVSCSDKHCIALTHEGAAFTWAKSSSGNSYGQLCRGRIPGDASIPGKIDIGQRVKAVAAGGGKIAGHTALVGEDGSLFTCGCDRWQQLGLNLDVNNLAGNPRGYTWNEGKLWQDSPQQVVALKGVKISKVALGTDHSIALDDNGRDVYAWGKSSENQLGTEGKAFLRAPTRSASLSCPVPVESGVEVTVRHVWARDDCSASLHSKSPLSTARELGSRGVDQSQKEQVVVVGKNCRELEREIKASLEQARKEGR
jgi:alpha-tubulin suppressor-like RCC1 family protein